MIDDQISDAVDRFLADDYGTASFAEWAGQRLGRRADRPRLQGRRRSRTPRRSPSTRPSASSTRPIREADRGEPPLRRRARRVDLAVAWPTGPTPGYELNLKEKDLRKFAQHDRDEFEFGRDDLEEFLPRRPSTSIQKVDLAPAREFLQDDWGRRSLAGWVHHKFGAGDRPGRPGPASTKAEIVRRLQAEARELYAQKEAEFPVRVGMHAVPRRAVAEPDPPLRPRGPGRLGLGAVPHDRSTPTSSARCSGPRSRRSCSTLAHKHYQGGRLAEELERRLEAAFGPGRAATSRPRRPTRRPSPSWPPGPAQDLGVETTADELGADAAATRPAHCWSTPSTPSTGPRCARWRRCSLLQILDSSWMEHLRAMDHLRSSIGLQGYAQIDPKVEYKREGMKIFAEMWNGVADKVTDLIFRVEQFDPEFLSYLGSRWQLDRAQTIHQSADSQLAAVAGLGRDPRRQQDAAIAASQQSTEKKHEPVRNVGKKVGRNDPCPCGSGKKFKACCMRKQSAADPF